MYRNGTALNVSATPRFSRRCWLSQTSVDSSVLPTTMQNLCYSASSRVYCFLRHICDVVVLYCRNLQQWWNSIRNCHSGLKPNSLVSSQFLQNQLVYLGTFVPLNFVCDTLDFWWIVHKYWQEITYWAMGTEFQCLLLAATTQKSLKMPF